MNDHETGINVEGLEEWEKAHILKVLNRDKMLKEHDERRVQQLAVRTQLSRMTDNRNPVLDGIMKVKTGCWVKELARRRGSVDPCIEARDVIYRSMGVRSPSKIKYTTSLTDLTECDKEEEFKTETLVKKSERRNTSKKCEQSCKISSYGHSYTSKQIDNTNFDVDNNENVLKYHKRNEKIIRHNRGRPKKFLRTWTNYEGNGMRQNGVPLPRYTQHDHVGHKTLN